MATPSMIDFLNITDAETYKQVYCLNPPSDSCAFGYCANPDIASLAVRLSSMYLVLHTHINFCLRRKTLVSLYRHSLLGHPHPLQPRRHDPIILCTASPDLFADARGYRINWPSSTHATPCSLRAYGGWFASVIVPAYHGNTKHLHNEGTTPRHDLREEVRTESAFQPRCRDLRPTVVGYYTRIYCPSVGVRLVSTNGMRRAIQAQPR